jgi:hypothetical protein
MHPTEADWQALVDGEATPAVAVTLHRHGRDCPGCRERYAVLTRARDERVVLFAALDVPVPRPDIEQVIRRAQREQRSLWRPPAVAAALLLCAAGAMAALVSPAGRRLVTRTWQWLAAANPLSRSAQARSGSPTSWGIAFAADGRIDIAFEAPQATGELRVRLSDSTGKALVVATAPVRYTVRSTHLTIGNAGSTASYDITIPRAGSQATLRVGGVTVLTKDHSRIAVANGGRRVGEAYVLPFRSLRGVVEHRR